MDTASDEADDSQQAQTEIPYEEWRDSMIAKAEAMLALEKMDQAN